MMPAMGKQRDSDSESIRAKNERRDLRRRMELTEERLALLERYLMPRQSDAVDLPSFWDHLGDR